MYFNSLSFAVFLPVVFVLYWFVTNRNLRLQNALLLVASYFFYSCWDYRFLLLLVFSTFLDYYTGIKMYESRTKKIRTFWFWLSVCTNVGFLGFFKYYNFFAASFARALSEVGIHSDPWVLNVILPVGISFYTFHGLSYVIDIYKGRISPERNFVDYSVFVSFFPLLVAGPIERATHLLPQIKRERVFDPSKMIDGLRQILWGLFKKMVIADRCAEFVNPIFAHSQTYSGATLALGAFLFAIQIYCDFSGYSDIALGTARLLGIDLLRNFNYPYFSRDIAEFWRRWHISLSSWFRDYLYIPLGGSKGSKWKVIRNTWIIFLVSGFWHGANWTFIAWGGLNALFIMPLVLFGKNRVHLETVARGKVLPTLREAVQIAATFAMTTLAWIVFRADSIPQAIHYVKQIFSRSLFTLPQVHAEKLGVLIGLFVILEWLGRDQPYAIARLGIGSPRLVRWSFYYALVFIICWFSGAEQQFIYFQF
jgi:alginate O-acetyltransferase complex protein AlgI